jgi:hypothetical protein
MLITMHDAQRKTNIQRVVVEEKLQNLFYYNARPRTMEWGISSLN